MPSLQLKRSASLKSPRENIRRRHIDRERRKTCNPVLIRSPRSPEEEAEFEWRRHSTGETFSSSKSGSEETTTSAETKQAVYRLMGEEIKLEEGIVRRQKEGNNMNSLRGSTELPLRKSYCVIINLQSYIHSLYMYILVVYKPNLILLSPLNLR